MLSLVRRHDHLHHPGAPAPGAVRAARADRHGRDGGGVPRAARRAARLPEDRRGQAHPAAARAGRRLRRRCSSTRRASARASATRTSCRCSTSARRTASSTWRWSTSTGRPARASSARRRRGGEEIPLDVVPPHRALVLRGARVRARRARRPGQAARARAPRRVARQRAHRSLGRREAHRLRHRARRRDRAPDRRGAAQGQARVHVARAGRGARARRAERSLHARHRPGRDAHPAAALLRRQGARRAPAHPRRGPVGASTGSAARVPDDVRAVLFRALAKDPRCATRTPRAFADALEDIVRRRRLQVGPARLAACVEKLGPRRGRGRGGGRAGPTAAPNRRRPSSATRARAGFFATTMARPGPRARGGSRRRRRSTACSATDGTMLGPMSLPRARRALRDGQ